MELPDWEIARRRRRNRDRFMYVGIAITIVSLGMSVYALLTQARWAIIATFFGWGISVAMYWRHGKMIRS